MSVPYCPPNRTLSAVPASDRFMREAEKMAKTDSLDENHPTGAVIVKEGEIIGRGANGSRFHVENGCERKRLGIPTGKNYELCEGCNPKYHAEQTAIRNAFENGKDPAQADLYLWGHWWCCEDCWEKMIKAKIKNVYLLDEAEKLFRKS